MLSFEMFGFTAKKTPPDRKELVSEQIASVVIQKYSLACQLHRIATSDDINETPTCRKAIESSRHPGRNRRRHQSRSDRNQKLQLTRGRDQGRRDDPWIFAEIAGGE